MSLKNDASETFDLKASSRSLHLIEVQGNGTFSGFPFILQNNDFPENTEPFYGSKDRNEAWIAEAIWGHRLERQPFSALLLEFLGMAEGMYRQGRFSGPYAPGR